MIELNTLTKITQALQVCYVSSKSNIPLANKKPGISAGPQSLTCLATPFRTQSTPAVPVPRTTHPNLTCHCHTKPFLACRRLPCHACTGNSVPRLPCQSSDSPSLSVPRLPCLSRPCRTLPYLTCHTQAGISPPDFWELLFRICQLFDDAPPFILSAC